MATSPRFRNVTPELGGGARGDGTTSSYASYTGRGNTSQLAKAHHEGNLKLRSNLKMHSPLVTLSIFHE